MDIHKKDIVSCPRCTKPTSFQQVIDIDKLGINILRYVADIVNQVPFSGDASSSKIMHDLEGKLNVFILTSNNNNNISSEDINSEFDINKVKCPRCRYRAEKILKLLPNKINLRKGDIKGICDHCKNEQQKSQVLYCPICEETIKKFRENISKPRKQTPRSASDFKSHLKSLIKTSTELYTPRITSPKHVIIKTMKPPMDTTKETPTIERLLSDESVITSFVTSFSKDEKDFKYVFPKDESQEIDIKPVETTSSTLLLNIQEKLEQQEQQKQEEQQRQEEQRQQRQQLKQQQQQQALIKSKEKAIEGGLLSSESVNREIGKKDLKRPSSKDKDKEKKDVHKSQSKDIEKKTKGEKKLKEKSSKEGEGFKEILSKEDKAKKIVQKSQSKDIENKAEAQKPTSQDKKKIEQTDDKGEKEGKKTPLKDVEKKTEAKKQDKEKMEPSDDKSKKDVKKGPLKDVEKKTEAKKQDKEKIGATEDKAKKVPPKDVERKTEAQKQDKKKLETTDDKAKKDSKKMPQKDVEKKTETQKPISKDKLQKEPQKGSQGTADGKKEKDTKIKEPKLSQQSKMKETDSANQKTAKKGDKDGKTMESKSGKDKRDKEAQKDSTDAANRKKEREERMKESTKKTQQSKGKEADKAQKTESKEEGNAQKDEKLTQKNKKIDKKQPMKSDKNIKEDNSEKQKGDIKEDPKHTAPGLDIMKFLPAKPQPSVDVKAKSQTGPKIPVSEVIMLPSLLAPMQMDFDTKGQLDDLAAGEYFLFKIAAKKSPQAQTKKKRTLKDLSIATKDVRMKGPSYDNLILKLIHQAQSKTSKKIQHQQKAIPQGKFKIRSAKRKISLLSWSIDSDFMLDFESLVNIVTIKDIRSKIKNTNIVQNIPEEKPASRYDPILFHKTHEFEQVAQIYDIEEEPKTEPELSKGTVRYALSDRTFIDKGWTVLPTLKVVRKMNVYKVQPANPEFNWFSNNKRKGTLNYDTGQILATFDPKGCGRWYYRNGRVALDYYDSEDKHAQQRFVIYSSGEQDERCRSLPVTILAIFDYLGNGVVFDHKGKIRIKYNQTEGVMLDSEIGPTSRWKWHTLNDPPELKQVMIDTHMEHPYPEIIKLGDPSEEEKREEDEDMLAIEFENFTKQKTVKKKFKPFQIRMKSLKINKQMSLKILDQAHVYLYFRDGLNNIKLNLGMILDHQEIIDTETADVSDVSTSIERYPPKTDSIMNLQAHLHKVRQCERERTALAMKIRCELPVSSADRLVQALSKPIRPTPSVAYGEIGNSHRKQSKTCLYYDTRLI